MIFFGNSISRSETFQVSGRLGHKCPITSKKIKPCWQAPFSKSQIDPRRVPSGLLANSFTGLAATDWLQALPVGELQHSVHNSWRVPGSLQSNETSFGSRSFAMRLLDVLWKKRYSIIPYESCACAKSYPTNFVHSVFKRIAAGANPPQPSVPALSFLSLRPLVTGAPFALRIPPSNVLRQALILLNRVCLRYHSCLYVSLSQAPPLHCGFPPFEGVCGQRISLCQYCHHKSHLCRLSCTSAGSSSASPRARATA